MRVTDLLSCFKGRETVLTVAFHEQYLDRGESNPFWQSAPPINSFLALHIFRCASSSFWLNAVIFKHDLLTAVKFLLLINCWYLGFDLDFEFDWWSPRSHPRSIYTSSSPVPLPHPLRDPWELLLWPEASESIPAICVDCSPPPQPFSLSLVLISCLKDHRDISDPRPCLVVPKLTFQNWTCEFVNWTTGLLYCHAYGDERRTSGYRLPHFLSTPLSPLFLLSGDDGCIHAPVPHPDVSTSGEWHHLFPLRSAPSHERIGIRNAEPFCLEEGHVIILFSGPSSYLRYSTYFGHHYRYHHSTVIIVVSARLDILATFSAS